MPIKDHAKTRAKLRHQYQIFLLCSSKKDCVISVNALLVLALRPLGGSLVTWLRYSRSFTDKKALDCIEWFSNKLDLRISLLPSMNANLPLQSFAIRIPGKCVQAWKTRKDGNPRGFLLQCRRKTKITSESETESNLEKQC